MTRQTPPLNIKNPEAYLLARQIADQTGKSLTRVVVDALRAERDRVAAQPVDKAKARAILASIHSLPILDSTPLDEMIDDLYDQNGLIR